MTTRKAAEVAAKQTASTGNANASANPRAASLAVDSGVLTEMQSSLQKATEEMARVGRLLTTLQEDVSEVKQANTKLRSDMDGVLLRLDEAERRVSELEDDNRQLRLSADKSTKKCEELHRAIEDAANRDRRQNLRLVGLKENMENGKIVDCVRSIIAEALGVELDPVQLQRVHRTPVPMPEDHKPPRPIIMRFLSYLERERVLAAAREKYKRKESIIWKGCKLSFFPDMTKETAEKRKKFTDARRRLHELDVRFTLAYPAELRFTWNGKRVKFTDHRQAMAFLNKGDDNTTEEM